MAKSPKNPATSAPAPAKVTPAPAPQVVEGGADPEKTYYYRIRKLTGFLYEILEVEVDETKQVPKLVSKQDMKHLLVDKMTDLVCPHPDTVAKRRREIAREKQKAVDAAKVVAAVVAKVQE